MTWAEGKRLMTEPPRRPKIDLYVFAR